MWVIFTYIWNSILIIFISLHLLVGAIITFFIGIYSGIYLCQNYEIPKIDEPKQLWTYFVQFLEERKKPGGISILQLTRTQSSKTLSPPSKPESSSREDINMVSSSLSTSSSLHKNK